MIKFKQKEYTIQEGHFTGVKDLEEVPGTLKTVGGATLGGAALGAGVGYLLGKTDKFKDDVDSRKGALYGAGAGLLTGIAAKVALDSMHNPMTSVKFQEVDRELRRKFGIYQVSGFTMGDSLENRGRYDQVFSQNDRDVKNYHINITIQNNQITMYTYNLSNQELKIVSDSLDYYCKKYFGMNYTSKVINSKNNTYSVTIVFTNTSVIGDYLQEISQKLGYKINLLDNKATVDEGLGVKNFSDTKLSKYDLMKIFGGSAVRSMGLLKTKKAPLFVLSTIVGSWKELSKIEQEKVEGKISREHFGNEFLLETLKKLRFVEGKQYTVGKDDCGCNIYVASGTLLISVPKDSGESSTIDRITDTDFKKADINGKVYLYSHKLVSKQDLEIVVSKIINTGICPNVYI